MSGQRPKRAGEDSFRERMRSDIEADERRIGIVKRYENAASEKTMARVKLTRAIKTRFIAAGLFAGIIHLDFA